MLLHHARRLLIMMSVALLLIGVVPFVVTRFRLNYALIMCAKLTHGQPVSCSLAINPQDTRASYHLGLNAWWANALPQTITYFGEYLSKNPKDQVAGLYLGMAYRRSGDEAKAFAIWRQTGALQYFVARGWQTGSIEDLQTAIAAGETKPSTFYKLGDVLWDVGRLQEAGQVYQEGLTLDTSDTSQSLLARARILELSKDWPQAINMYQSIAELWPNSPDTYYRIGNIYRKELGNRAEALSWYIRCVQKTRSESCYLAAGEVNREAKNYEAAHYWGTQAHDVFPNSSSPLIFIAVTWEEEGNLGEAQNAYQNAANMDQSNFWIPYYQGYLAMNSGNLDKAEEFFLQSARLNPTSQGVQMGLGEVYRKSGRIEAAINAYRRALNLSPGEAAAEQALKELTTAP